jgi:predicted O-linked N-acetylglucosamine transferase (SPINDLY family)
MPWFDFVIADRYALPEELTTYFTEKPLYIDGSFIPLTRDDAPLPDATRSAFGLAEDAFVMAAFGNVYKITPEMFATWMALLKEIPKAILWIIDDNPATTANLKAHATAANIDLNKIKFTPRTTHIEYKAKLKLADVFLDTFPYNGHTTAGDALSAGLPVVTLCGNSFASRVAGSLMHDIGVNDLLSESLQQYHDKALTFATNQEVRVSIEKALHHKLTNNKWPPSSMAQADALQTILKAL